MRSGSTRPPAPRLSSRLGRQAAGRMVLATLSALLACAAASATAGATTVRPVYRFSASDADNSTADISVDGSRLVVARHLSGDSDGVLKSIDLRSRKAVRLRGRFLDQSADGRTVLTCAGTQECFKRRYFVTRIHGGSATTHRLRAPRGFYRGLLRDVEATSDMGVGADGTIWLLMTGYRGGYHGAIFRVPRGRSRFRAIRDPTNRHQRWDDQYARASNSEGGSDRLAWGYCKGWPQKRIRSVSMTLVSASLHPTWRTVRRRAKTYDCLQSPSGPGLLTYGSRRHRPPTHALRIPLRGKPRRFRVGAYSRPVGISPSGKVAILARWDHKRRYLIVNFSNGRRRVVHRRWPGGEVGSWSQDERWAAQPDDRYFVNTATGRRRSAHALKRTGVGCFIDNHRVFGSDTYVPESIALVADVATRDGRTVLSRDPFKPWRQDDICRAGYTPAMRHAFAIVSGEPDAVVYASRSSFDGTLHVMPPP